MLQGYIARQHKHKNIPESMAASSRGFGRQKNLRVWVSSVFESSGLVQACVAESVTALEVGACFGEPILNSCVGGGLSCFRVLVGQHVAV